MEQHAFSQQHLLCNNILFMNDILLVNTIFYTMTFIMQHAHCESHCAHGIFDAMTSLFSTTLYLWEISFWNGTTGLLLTPSFMQQFFFELMIFCFSTPSFTQWNLLHNNIFNGTSLLWMTFCAWHHLCNGILIFKSTSYFSMTSFMPQHIISQWCRFSQQHVLCNRLS